MNKGIDLRLLGDTGINIPYTTVNTSGRMTMSMTQQTQIPVIKNPEEEIVSTGYSTQLVKHTFSVTVPNDSIFLKAIKKFGNRLDQWSDDEWTTMTIFVIDTDRNEVRHFDIPNYRILGNKFGFEYNIDYDYISSLNHKDIIPAGTRLAWSNANKGNTHKKGRNLNMFIGSLPETGEDCTLMSDRVLDDYSIKIYEEYEVSYGKSSILAEVYNKASNTYKSFPDIGDEIAAGEIIFNKVDLDITLLKNRDYNIIKNAMLFTQKGIRKRRAHFTNHVVARYPGRVVDIELHYNNKSGETVTTEELTNQTNKYYSMSRTYHNSIVSLALILEKDYPDLTISPATNGLIVDSKVYVEHPINGRTPNITKIKKNATLDMYTLKVIVECTIKPNQGFKYSNRFGG